jgi:CheY-like chemotaxis protein
VACRSGISGWGQAFRIIRADPPDVVVIDLARRPSHGREVAQALYKTAATRHIPLVFVDGNADAVDGVQRRVPTGIFTTWDRLLPVLEQMVNSAS